MSKGMAAAGSQLLRYAARVRCATWSRTYADVVQVLAWRLVAECCHEQFREKRSRRPIRFSSALELIHANSTTATLKAVPRPRSKI